MRNNIHPNKYLIFVQAKDKFSTNKGKNIQLIL